MSKKIGTAVVGLLTALAMTLPGVTIANATEPKTETDKSPAAQESYTPPQTVSGEDLAARDKEDTSKSGVVGEYKPEQAQPMPNERYSGWPLVGGLMNKVFTTDKNVGKMTFSEDGDNPEGDGAKIEKIDVKWLCSSGQLSDADGQKNKVCTQNPSTNDGLTFGARVDFSISGQYELNPGDVEITLPLNIFQDRSGKDEGVLDVSIPEDPERGTVFAYKRVDGKIIATNVQTIPAAYQGYFEVYWDKIIPAEVVSGSRSADFGAVITLVTNKGNTLQKTSNTIYGIINTYEKVTSAEKRGNLYRSWPGWNEKDLTLPDGFNKDDYYYVDWYTYAYITGNQYFNIGLKDTPVLNQPVDPSKPDGDKWADGIIIGGDAPGGKVTDNGKTYTAENIFGGATGGYIGSGYNFYYHMYMAYPKSQFEQGVGAENPGTGDNILKPENGQKPGSSSATPLTLGQMKNEVTYTLTSKDTKQVTSASDSATVQVREYPYAAPYGHFMVYKWGVDQDGRAASVWPDDEHYHYDDQGNKQPVENWNHIGEYNYAINMLAQNKDVNLTYDVVTTNYPYPWTYKCDNDGHDISNAQGQNVTKCNPKDPANYNKRFVDVEVRDHDTYFHEMSAEGGDPLTVDDFEFTSLRVLDSVMWSYTGSIYNGWNYTQDRNVARPNIDLYGKTTDGEWVKYGTASWDNDGKGSLVLTPENGATVSGSVLNFPANAGIVDWKMNYSTNAAGIYTGVLPTMKLKATEKTKKIADELMDNNDKAYTDARNVVTMDVTQVNNGKTDNLLDELLTAQGVDRLSSASQSVYMRKNVQMKPQSNEDKVNKLVRLTYNATVTSSTNQTSSESYNEVMAQGVLPRDDSGTYFDLLPMGVTVDERSVKVNGSLQSTHLINNWRGSGRNMLIVKVKNNTTPTRINDKYGQQNTISFDATYTWNEMKDITTYLNNNIAYASNAPYLGTIKGLMGEPDDPTAGNNTDSKGATQGVVDYMKDLVDNDNPSVVYANAGINVHARTYAFAGLQKDVSSDVDGKWGTGLDLVKNNETGKVTTDESKAIDVPTGGTYKYRIRMETSSGEKLKNIVFYDNLEGYTPTKDKLDYQKPTWEGSFMGVNVEPLKAKGIAPVVYYSTQHVDLTKYHVTSNPGIGDNQPGVIESIPDLSDTSVWTTELPADPSTVKSIAIDCKKKADGTDFELAENQGVQALIQMRAPSSDVAKTAIEQDAHAYNNIYMSSTQITQAGQTADHYIHQDYTKLGLYPFNINVTKNWVDDDNRDGVRPDSVQVQLTRNGQPYGDVVTLNDGNKWKHSFEYLEKTEPNGTPIDWSVQEVNVPEGYTFSISMGLTDKGDIDATATNTHEIDRVSGAGTKTWTDETNGTATRPKSITVNLFADGKKIQSKTVTPDISGNWTYDFGNLPKNVRVDGVTHPIVYTVTEDYVEGYVPEYADGQNLNVVNKYYPYGDITLTKSATDTTDASKDKDFTFQLTLQYPTGAKDEQGDEVYDYDTGEYQWERSGRDVTDVNRTGTIKNGGTVTIKAGQTITVKKVPSRDKYAWTEQDLDGFTVGSSNGLTGTVTSGGKHDATIENVYKTAGYGQLAARKTLDGRELGNRQFRFEVYPLDSAGRPVELFRTASNDKNGVVRFSAIGYTNKDVDKTYDYAIIESNAGKPGYTYSYSVFIASMKILDNGDGTITAVPTYYNATINEDGDGLSKGDKVENASTNNLPLFENTYKANGYLDLTANKVFVGGDLSKRPFTFAMTSDAEGKNPVKVNDQGVITSDGSGVDVTAVSNENGEAVFPTIRFSQEDLTTRSADGAVTGYLPEKQYTFYVHEVKNDIDGDEKDIVWDNHVESVKVTLTDNGDGTLFVKQEFRNVTGSSASADVPLVWRNSAEKGGLKIMKHITKDEQSRSETNKKTMFPMEVNLALPNGAELKDADPNTDGIQLKVTVATPNDDWYKNTDVNVDPTEDQLTKTETTVTVKDNRFRIGVPAEGYVVFDNNLPGGTSYLATEVSSLSPDDNTPSSPSEP